MRFDTPWGDVAHCDASVLPVQKISPHFCTGNTALSQWGDLSGGPEPKAEPLERQNLLNNFFRARKILSSKNPENFLENFKPARKNLKK
jgi:hypothetical protein